MEKNLLKKRIRIISIVMLIIILVLTFRIFIYQYFKSGELKVIAQNQYQYQEKMNELNYLLLDNKGRDLLSYSNKYYVVIDPYNFRFNDYYTKKDELYALNIILKGYKKEYNLDNIDLKNKSEKILWTINEETYDKLSEIKGIKGFYTYRYSKVDRDKNYWSIENILTNLYKIDSNGNKIEKDKNSLEHKIAEKTSSNKDIYNILKKDVNGNVYNEYITNAKGNINVRTTLDKHLQDSIKQILQKTPYANYEQVGAVLMESETGKIRAMVQKDDSKPNINLGVATNHGFFPGSIFKVITEECGLENSKISLNKKYRLNPDLNLRYNGHENKEILDPAEALIQSSNDVYAQIGIDVGFKSMQDMAKKHCMTSKVLNLDEESYGCFEGNHEDMGDTELTAFGQKQRITPIEAISIPNTVINKGIYVKPHIIEAYVNGDNVPLEKLDTDEHRIISDRTADILKNQMIQVVTSPLGTGGKAYVSGANVGGKTGTAEREEGKNKFHDGWFAGFFECGKKKYSMIVFVKNIGGDLGGGSTAAPIFKEIVENTTEYLNKF